MRTDLDEESRPLQKAPYFPFHVSPADDSPNHHQPLCFPDLVPRSSYLFTGDTTMPAE